MLTIKQVQEIKEHLERAQSPIFFFDNDQDGLCSFLLLQRYLGRGKGVAVKSFPDLDASYFRKVEELSGDYIFILDKPVVSESFFEEAHKFNIPIVWIDHHEAEKKLPEFVNYYNPLYNSEKTNEPVTALCYQITSRKEDLWLAVIGCISDRFYPSFYSEFKNQFPELSIESEDAFDIFYKSEIGKIAKMFSFGLKDNTTNVVLMLKFLIKSGGPYDVLEKTPKNRILHERFELLSNKYRKLLNKAIDLNDKSEKILFFEYGGDLSISGDLSNELSYLFPKKFIIVGYIKGIKINLSARGKNIKPLMSEAIKGLEGGRSGGHDNAVGAQMRVDDLEKFKSNLISLCSNLLLL